MQCPTLKFLPRKTDRRTRLITLIDKLATHMDQKSDSLVDNLLCIWCDRISAMAEWPGVSIQRLREIVSQICSFHLSVAVLTTKSSQSPRCTSMLCKTKATEQQTHCDVTVRDKFTMISNIPDDS